MLSCFCLGILQPPFHNYFWNILSHVSIISTSILSLYSSRWQLYLFLACETLCLLSSENGVWVHSWGSCIFLTLRECSSIIHPLFFGWTRRVNVRIRPYQSIHVLAPLPVSFTASVVSQARLFILPKPLVSPGWAISFLLCTNGLRKRSSGHVGPPFLAVRLFSHSVGAKS